MIRLPIRAALALSILTATATAQLVQVSPNPITSGSSSFISITDTTGLGMEIQTGCGWLEIRQGTQNGPVVPFSSNCASVPITIPGNAAYSWGWDQIDGSTGQLVAPGRYWIHATTATPGGPPVETWNSIDVVDASSTAPVLYRQGVAATGLAVPFSLTAPTLPNAPFATLFSFDQTNPLSLPGFVDLALSAPLFVVDSGTLDAGGSAPTFSFSIPNDPSLSYSGFHLQSIVVDPALALIDSNALSVLIY